MHLPHLGNTVQAVVAKILTDDAEPVRKRRKTVPVHVDAAVQKALAKLPAGRFASAAEFGRRSATLGLPSRSSRAGATERPPIGGHASPFR
jgi:hypothetical protein